MDALYQFLIAPFTEFAFMQRGLLGTVLLSFSACPIGVFLMLRRMSLTGDAMAHAILPGAAAGFLLYGLQIVPMTIGGLLAGAIVALGAGAVSRLTIQKEDASMAAFYLISLALGVTTDLVARFQAGTLIRGVAEIVGGKGGGKADFAQAGGRDAARIPEALAKLVALVEAGS